MTPTYEISLSPERYSDVATRHSRRLIARMHTRWVYWLCMVGAGAVAGFYIGAGFDEVRAGFGDVAAFGGLAGLAGLWLLGMAALRSGARMLFGRSTFMPGLRCEMEVDDEGLHTAGPHGQSFYRWTAFRDVETVAGDVVLCFDDLHYFPVPATAFAGAEERERFVAFVRSHIAAAREAAPAPASRVIPEGGVQSAAAPPASTRTGLRKRAAQALRLAFLRRVDEEELHPTWTDIVAASLLAVVAPTLAGWFAWGGAGQLGLWNLPEVLFHVPVALVAATLLAAVLGRLASVPALLLATLLAGLVIDVVTIGLWYLPIAGDLQPVFFVLQPAWLALAVTRFAAGLTKGLAWRPLAAFATAALFLAFPLAYFHHERSLWVKDWSRETNDEGFSARFSAASEDAFYRQPELLARELAAVAPGRPGVIDVFFVGMAGYGRQDVFKREVDSVAQLMRERFDADGRTIRLVNNSKTALTNPIATVTSLRAALKRVAEAMDIEEDVLVLFMTSHGSENHRFALELWPFRFNELDPDVLRRALDESGIRNRVVVVSACYSGGFVERLKDDHTLVIAASAPDRNSFGCSNENEWTYFGRAYFDEALRKTRSFTEAFALALPVIAEREKAQSQTPSDPRIAAGAAIAPRLEALVRQLESGRDLVERPRSDSESRVR